MKTKILLGVLSSVFATSIAHAQNSTQANQSSDDASVQTQINSLKAQISQLERKVNQEKNVKNGNDPDSPAAETADVVQEYEEFENTGSRFSGVRNLGVGTGHEFGLDSENDGTQLLITAPQLNKDYNLLLTNQFLTRKIGPVSEEGARLQISGTVQASYEANSKPFGQFVDDVGDYVTEDKNDLLAQGEFDMAAEINDWWTGYLHFYSGTDPGDNVQMEQAFIVLGNLDKSPTYGSAGLLFLPNGSFYTEMVSRPLTREMGRSRDTAAVAATVWDGFGGRIFAYDSERQRENESNTVETWGASADYTQADLFDIDETKVKVGVGYVNDISGAEGIAASDVLDIHEEIRHYIPAGDVFARFDYDDLTFFAEYIQYFKSFERTEISYNDHGARISAGNFEATYRFDWGRPSWLTANYGFSREALGAQIPEQVFGATYGVHVLKNTVLSFELLEQINYGDDFAFAASNDDVVIGDNRHNLQFTAQVDVFF